MKTEAKYFHVKGRLRYDIVVRETYMVDVDEVVEADNEYAAIDKLVDREMEKHEDEGEYDELWRKLDAKEVEPPSPPAEDVVLWSMSRSVAPTLFPVEELIK